MAPNGRKASQRRNRHQSQKSSCHSWLETNGKAEFDKWRLDNPTQEISYEVWKKSEHVEGLSLFFAAADILNESDSSDDDENLEPEEVKPRPHPVRTLSAREPKKKVTVNDKRPPHAALSAIPAAHANSDDLSPASKRQRRAKKSFLSEETVDSDSHSDGQQTPSVGLVKQNGATAPVPTTAVNGKRKSSGRKSKKKFLSEEIISPEDEMDDPMSLGEVVPPLIASPLPVRPAPKATARSKTTAQTSVQNPEPPKKTHIIKLITRKTPKKPDSPEQDERMKVTVAPTSATNIAATSKPSKASRNSKSVEVEELYKTIQGTSTTESAGPTIDASTVAPNQTPTQSVEAGADSAVNSPNPTDLSASGTRRGLRTRRPAQQRPYYHDAQLFDDVEPNISSPGGPSTASPELRSRRASAVSFVNKPYDTELLAHLDAEALAILQDDAEDEPVGERRPKTFKGKGRAWKKEESDEDDEFIVDKKKAAKAAKAKAKNQAPTVPKKRGRPRKSALPEDMILDRSELPGTTSAHNSPAQSPSPATTVKEGAKKGRKPSRKSLLSAEIIEDSDSDIDASLNTVSARAESTAASTPKSKKVAKARKSDQSTTSRSSVRPQDDVGAVEPIIQSTTPVSTPRKSYKPSDMMDGRNYTPMGMPRSLRLSLSDTVEGAKEDVEVAGDEPLTKDDKMVEEKTVAEEEVL